MQGICIYIVYTMGYSGILAEYNLIQDFVSRSVNLSSRSIFLNVLKSGIDFLVQCLEEESERGSVKSLFFQSIKSVSVKSSQQSLPKKKQQFKSTNEREEVALETVEEEPAMTKQKTETLEESMVSKILANESCSDTFSLNKSEKRLT